MSSLSLKGLSPADIKALRRHCVSLTYQAERGALVTLSREVLEAYFSQQNVDESLRASLAAWASLTLEESPKWDEWIRTKSTNWSPERMGRIDLAILRVCLTELVYRTGAKPAIVIADAAEIAKEFGSDHSQSFVHGILDAVVKAYVQPAADKKESDD